MRPTLLQNKVLSNVYASGVRVRGTKEEIFTRGGGLTTCELKVPHFSLNSRDTDIRPGKRIIMHDVDLRIMNKSIFRLPYLSIPIDKSGDRYLPEVGQSRDEGVFVKARFGTDLNATDFSSTRIEAFSKLGLGLGEDLLYRRGSLKVYGIVGPSKTFTLNQSHSTIFGKLRLDINSNLQRSTYFNSPENKIFDTRWNLAFSQGLSVTRLSAYRSTNDSPGFSALQQLLTLSDSRVFSRQTRTNTDITLTSSKSSVSGGSDITRDQLDVRFRGQHDLKKALAELEYQRSIPIGKTTNFFSYADRTPVFSLKSDSTRLFGSRQLPFPFQTSFSLGEFVDPSSKSRITRGNFDLATQRSDDGTSRFGFDFNGRFLQGWYSDDTAQYSLDANLGLRWRFSKSSSVNLHYSFLRPYGFSPLQIDRSGQNNVLSADATIKPLRTLSLAAQTGYDFLLEKQSETAWQTLGVRAEWRPRSWFNFRSLATYDPFSRAWSNLRLDSAYRSGSMFLSVGARYDGLRHQWGNTNLFLDGLRFGRFKAAMLLTYNGYLKQFESRRLSLIYDLHCAEAVIELQEQKTGFRPGTTFNFFIRLKAFPFNTPFGVGRRGAPIGTGTGRDGF